MTTTQIDTFSALEATPRRCAIVVDEALAPGHAANAAALLGLSLGARLPRLAGDPWSDGEGLLHPGHYPAGLPILRGAADRLGALLATAAADDEVGVIVLPAVAQTTTDYAAFMAAACELGHDALAPVGVLVAGPDRRVRSLTGSFGLLR